MGERKVKIKILKKVSDNVQENVIEWLTDETEEDTLSITLSKNSSLTPTLKKASKKYPELLSLVQNKDGSIFCHIPRSWLSITVPKLPRSAAQKATAQNLKPVQKS